MATELTTAERFEHGLLGDHAEFVRPKALGQARNGGLVTTSQVTDMIDAEQNGGEAADPDRLQPSVLQRIQRFVRPLVLHMNAAQRAQVAAELESIAATLRAARPSGKTGRAKPQPDIPEALLFLRTRWLPRSSVSPTRTLPP